jgi:hypothetical protein
MTDIASALQEAFDKHTEEPVTESVSNPESEQSPEPEQTESGAVRDEKGRFAAKVTEPQPEAEAVQEMPVRKAPSSWKPAAQEAFLKADRGEALTQDEIKLLTQEAERRESDFHRGLNDFKSHSERARAYDQVIAPYQQHLQRLGVDAPTAINALMKADVTLRTSDPATKAAYFAQLAQEYGIDLGQVQQPVNQDPQTQYLMQQINELRQTQQMWQNQIQQQEQMKAQKELESFGYAEKPHFDAVRGDMADLLESGKAGTLQDAYEMAVWMRQDIRQTLISQQIADAQRKASAEAQTQRAKTAAVSVKGSSPASAGGQPINGSIGDILRSQFADN